MKYQVKTLAPIFTLEDLREQLNLLADDQNLAKIYPIDGGEWKIEMQIEMMSDGSGPVFDASITRED